MVPGTELDEDRAQRLHDGRRLEDVGPGERDFDRPIGQGARLERGQSRLPALAVDRQSDGGDPIGGDLDGHGGVARRRGRHARPLEQVREPLFQVQHVTS